ncbi:MAG: MFS transporter [Candidatus Nanopelagicales bacterium]|jgi:fucose permease|nr:MFS transporter [Candidatus Nanopelagicales bacterium]MDP5045775.1 MFS transporter [Candidatus Nanopelagicaceae bacterium]
MDLALRRARIAVTITFIINGFSAGSFVARIPDFKRILDISNATLGLSLLFISAGVFLALKPAGKYSAKYGSQPIIFFSTIALALSYLLLGALFSLTWFWITLFIFGFVLAAQDVSMNAHAVVVEQRAGRRLMSVFHAMFSVGTLFGGILGGVFSQFEITPLTQGSSLALLYIVAALLVRPLFLPASADTHHFGDEKRAKHPPIFAILGLFGLFAALSEGAAGDWGGVLARETFGASPFISTLPYIVFCTAMIIGRLSGDYLAHRFGASKVIAAGGVIAGTGLSAGLVIGGIPAIMVAWFLLGIGLSVVIPLMFSAAGTIALTRYSGVIAPSEAVAKVSGVSYFGFVIGPPLIGFIADAFELRWTLMLLAGLSYLLILASRYARVA